MNKIKRILGLVWLLLGPLTVGVLAYEGYQKIVQHPVQDVYLPWIIIFFIAVPVAAGLSLFGYYAWKGEYDEGRY